MAGLKNMSDVYELIASLSQDKSKLTNASIMDLISKYNTWKGRKKIVNYKYITEKLHEISGLESLELTPIQMLYTRKSLLTVKSVFLNLIKKIVGNSDKIQNFLREEYIIPKRILSVSAGPPPPVRPDFLDLGSPRLSPASNPRKVVTPPKTRNDCMNCMLAKKTNCVLEKRLKQAESRARCLKNIMAKVKREFIVKGSEKGKIASLEAELKSKAIQFQYSERRRKKLLTINAELVTQVAKCKSENLELNEKLMELRGLVAELTNN